MSWFGVQNITVCVDVVCTVGGLGAVGRIGYCDTVH